MELLLDLLQGAGIAAAIGIRPALPILLVGALAAADLGLDFGGTDFAFLESWPFLLGAVLLVVVLDLITRRGVGLVPEGRRLFPRLSVEDNLRLGAYARRGDP